ncbi:MAG TPA: hypothetical protein VMW63_08525, partial [Methanoregulaceae archaeon]|nr:hypothetical protein [Methanoregulaceae archaeon]
SSNDVELFPPPIRFYVDSLSTLLMYRKLEVLYQFLHVMTAKLKKMGALGIYILNKDSFDQRTIELMKQLMDVVIDIKEESSNKYISVKGVPGVSADWVRYHIENGSIVVES